MSYFTSNHHDRNRDDRSIGLAVAVLASGAIAACGVYWLMTQRGRGRLVGHAPRSALRSGSARNWRESNLVSRAVTINRPRDELFAFWRDFSNLPAFMANVRAVDVLDDRRTRWTIAAPGGGEVEFTTTITEEQPGELIAWQSEEDAQVRNSGRIVFRDAPAGRGTEVEATIAYDPPGGTVGRLAAKLFQRETNIQARRDLKRFKQLMETGEVSVSDMAPAA